VGLREADAGGEAAFGEFAVADAEAGGEFEALEQEAEGEGGGAEHVISLRNRIVLVLTKQNEGFFG